MPWYRSSDLIVAASAMASRTMSRPSSLFPIRHIFTRSDVLASASK